VADIERIGQNHHILNVEALVLSEPLVEVFTADCHPAILLDLVH
jgi:copper oxidase (laccase) domain-containing protein